MDTRSTERQDGTQAKGKAAKKRAKRERIAAAIQPGEARVDIRAGLSAAIDARNHAKAFAAAVAVGDDKAAKAALDQTLYCLATAGRQRGYGDA